MSGQDDGVTSSYRPQPLERAFQLADTGEYMGAADIRQQMLKEGLAVDQVFGPVLLNQLRTRCRKAREAAAAAAPESPSED